jgi:two-component system sensor histidine kinase PilS (NtrC family)
LPEASTPGAAGSLTSYGASSPNSPLELRRRISYLMLFRLALITLVLGATLLISWLSELDLASPSSLMLFGIIVATYVLTIIYALLLHRVANPLHFAYLQLAIDLATTTLLVHLTGGAQSAYTFFYPVTIVGAATIGFRRGAVVVVAASVVLFGIVSLSGWVELLPTPDGQRLRPSDLSRFELARALGLNAAAFVAVGFLAVNLSNQLLLTSASLESEREAAADLFALHEDIVRCLSSGLITVDNGGTVLTMNQAAREIFGATSRPTPGTHLSHLAPCLADAVSQLPARERLRRAEVEAKREDGSPLVLGISVSPLVDHLDQQLGNIINFQDLTEMRRMEAAMRQAERLATIGTVAAGVAHELRNPLASISGSIELLRQTDNTNGEDGRTLMEIVTREVERLDALISDMLDYTNPRPRQMVRFDVHELIVETVQVFRQDPNVGDVEVRVLEGSSRHGVRMTADPGKLRQVLWNLLRNGAEAARMGGGHVEVELQYGDDQVVIDVRDDGPGIPAEIRRHIFEPFFTTRVRGTGLGLAVVQSIIIEHGGEIDVDTQTGVGTTFAIRLPLHTEPRLESMIGA